MAKYLKTPVLWTFAMLLIGAAGLFFALPWLVSSDLMKEAIEREISNFTGRKVILASDVELDLFPSPKIGMSNLRVPAKNNGGRDILVISRIEADISLLTILSRNPEFTALKLIGPHLTLQNNALGDLNWAEAFGRINAATKQAKTALTADAATRSKNSENTVPKQIQLLPANYPTRMGSVSFTSGKISIEGDTAQKPVQLTALNGTISWNDLAGAANSKINGVYNGQPVQFEAQVQRPLALLAGDKSAVRITGESALGKFSYDGVIGIFGSFFAAGNIQILALALSPLIEWLDGTFKPDGEIGALSLSGAMQITNRRVRFEPLNIQLDKNIGKGLLEITYPPGVKPLISGTFDFPELNVVDLIDVFVKIPRGGLLSLQKPEFKLLEQIRADIRVSAKTARLATLPLANLAVTAQINDEAAIFDIGDVELFSGNFQSQLQLSKNNAGKDTVQITLSGQQIDTRLAAQKINLPSIIPFGKADFTLSSLSDIDSWYQMAQSAEGKITFKMSNGSMRGFGAKTLLESENKDPFFTITNENNSEEPFGALDFVGMFSDGVIMIDNTVIRYPSGEVSFEGVAPYPSKGIALTAIATPLKTSKDPESRMFFIGGSWEGAFATPLLAPIVD